MVITDVLAGGVGGGGEAAVAVTPSSPLCSPTLPATYLPKPVEGSMKVDKGGVLGSSVLVKEEDVVSAVLLLAPTTRPAAPTTPDGACRGCGGSPSSSSSMEETFRAVTIKEEEVVKEKEEEEEEEEDIVGVFGGCCFDDGGGKCINNGWPSSSSSSTIVVVPKPMEGLHEMGPPPFLKKTFQMVEDRETDPIVSWSKKRDSFIVWDSHEFSKTLLPKYFKHGNFSSFIRQLNTYGFRKIDPDRWEFANEGFQGGKKHLLKNIKRRSRYTKQQQGAMRGADSMRLGLDAEFNSLKNDQDVLKVEISKLRQQKEDSQSQLSAVEERIRAVECKQLQMFIFFSKVIKNPGLIQQLIQKRRQQGQLDGGHFCKRRRMLQTQVAGTLPAAVDASDGVYCRNQAQEQLANLQSEFTEILPDGMETGPTAHLFAFPMGDEFCCPAKDDEANVICGTSPRDMSSVYNIMSEKLMDDNHAAAVESMVEEDLDVNDSKFYLELEDLIGNSKRMCY